MAGSIDAIAAGIATVGQARAALGEASRLLQQAYEKVSSVPGGSDVRAAVTSLLDSANAYAQKTYAALSSNDDDQGDEIDQQTRLQVAASLHFAERGLADVEDSMGETYWDFPAAIATVLEGVGRGLAAGASAIGKGAGAAAGGLFSGLGIFWTLALVGLVFVMVFGWPRRAVPL
jgi:hypothetical protein